MRVGAIAQRSCKQGPACPSVSTRGGGGGVHTRAPHQEAHDAGTQLLEQPRLALLHLKVAAQLQGGGAWQGCL